MSLFESGLYAGVPALVKGEWVSPPRIAAGRLRERAAANGGDAEGARSGVFRFAVEDAQVLRLPAFDRSTLAPTGEHQFLVLPQLDPGTLIEREPQRLARDLYRLPVAEVLAYVGALQQALRDDFSSRAWAADLLKATSGLDDRTTGLFFEMLPELLDPGALAEAIDRELGSAGVPGRRYLDGWVDVEAEPAPGMTARLRHQFFGPPAAPAAPPQVRAVPTRQLHVTAGNSPAVPVLSFVRALATRGAAVIKSPAEATVLGAVLAAAMRAVDPAHPITRHTSLVYWQGGDRSMEDVLFARGAFDRLVVWGDQETVSSVAARAGIAKAIFLNPRYGVSLIGREAFPDRVQEAAVLAAADSIIANQQACSSSLVHYVEGSEKEALAYCQAVRQALARWDERLPHRLPPAAQGRLRRLRRGELLEGRWLENGAPGAVTSAVVYMSRPFDLASHPLGRLIVVRRVDDLEQVLPYLSSSVSTIGIYPEGRRRSLCDGAAAAGVSNVLPLGDGERAYAGMPHDGMRVLSELVHWVSA